MERRMARTADELLEDQQQEEEEEEEVISEPDDDEVPYNPKNLPLGWDGKVRRLGISLGGTIITLNKVLKCDTKSCSQYTRYMYMRFCK